MAPAAKPTHSRPPSVTSTTSSDQGSQAPSTPTKTWQENLSDHQEASISKDEENTVDGNDIKIASQPSLTRRNYRKKPYHAAPPLEDTSDSSVIASQIPARSTRLRSKRYPSRLNTQNAEETTQVRDPNDTDSANLTIPWPTDDHDTAVTPKASTFDRNDQPISPIKSPGNKEERQRTVSSESRLRKTSSNSRTRKISSNSNKEAARKSIRDSVADFGDDEGYNELLSAYESEESTLS
jgi:hypothetical protein